MKTEKPVQTVHYFFKWSCVISGMASFMTLGIIFASWFAVEAMVVIITLVD